MDCHVNQSMAVISLSTYKVMLRELLVNRTRNTGRLSEIVGGWLRVLVSRTTVDHDASLSDAPKQMVGICRKSYVRREEKSANRTGCNDESICWRGKKFQDIVREIESRYVQKDIPKIAISNPVRCVRQ